ncbi:MAG: ABC transporter ATP-binding protein [Candidatus Omnitrophota bacterium]
MSFIDSKRKILVLKDINEALKFFWRFNKYIFRYWKLELSIMILGNLSMGLALLNPYLGKLILDKGIFAKDLNALFAYSLLAVVVFLLGIIFSITFDYLKNYALAKVEVDLNRDLFKRLRDSDFSQLQESPMARNIFRITNDITSVATIINVTLVHLINAVLRIIFITIIIIIINPVFLLIVLVYQFLVIARMKLLVKPLEELKRLGLERGEDIYRALNNFFSHIYLMKAFATIGREITNYMHNLLDLIRLDMKEARLRGISNFLVSFVDKIFFGILAFYAAYLVLKGNITFGTMVATLLYISQGIVAYSTLINMSEELVLNKVSLERVASLFDKSVTRKRSPRDLARPVDIRKIEFKNVSFAYQPDRELLKNMSFSVDAGSHIGLVGYSGCGKTTLLNLVLGLYKPKGGTIIIGNNELGDIDSKYLLGNFGVALQEPFLFDDSISNNISYALRDISQKDIIEATQIVGASTFVESLPQDFDTVVGENAYKISQGQKQRIAIARAIIKKPQVLILDEALSSLDPASEMEIIELIKRKFYDSTIIVVSHRLTTIQAMDLVYFFQSPTIMRVGRHNELLEKSKEYKEFFKLKPYGSSD